MKLPHPFIQLPVLFDAPALAAEIAALDESAWVSHPQGFPGNSALPLISANGDVDDDGFSGPMRPTPLLEQLPRLRGALAALGCVLGRSRLMRLSGNAEVKKHVDQGYYWAERMRVHVPIVTNPQVLFWCGGSEIHMAAGECWIFDTWRHHRVCNNAGTTRIHLVVDTVGGDGLRELLGRSRPHGAQVADWQPARIDPQAGSDSTLEFETLNAPAVMSPWELRAHIGFLFTEAKPHPDLPALQRASVRFLQRWLALWTACGEAAQARPRYQALLDEFVAELRRIGRPILLRNEVSIADAMQAMVTRSALADGGSAPYAKSRTRGAAGTHMGRDEEFDRPVFVVSSPRAGSTLLFETLARAPGVYTIGGESHALIETIKGLHPAACDYASNVIEPEAATPAVVAELRARFLRAVHDHARARPARYPMRLLEKTPKNSLRIRFLARVFPEAHFVYLRRDPRATLSSMIEAWESGRFRTYPQLPGWSGPPWSLLLTPDWRALDGKPLHEIVAAQWEAATRILLDDLQALPGERRSVVDYDAFVADPQAQTARLCAALDFDWTETLGRELPLSRYTVSKPDPEKWRRHADLVESVMESIAATARRAAAAG